MWKGGEWVEELNADRLIAEKNNYGKRKKIPNGLETGETSSISQLLV